MKKISFLFFVFFILLKLVYSNPKNCLSKVDPFLIQTDIQKATDFSQKLTHHSFEIKKGSIFSQIPQSLFVIKEMDKVFISYEEILKKNPYITKYEMYLYQINQLNLIADLLKSYALSYEPFNYRLSKFISQTSLELEINKKKTSQILKRIERTNGRHGHFDPPNRKHAKFLQNKIELQGFLGKFQGERGELFASIILPNIENRSLELLELLISNFQPYKHLQPLFKQFKNLKLSKKRNLLLRQIKEEIKLIIEPKDRHILERHFESIFQKEIDLTRNNGKEWIEVKNYNHTVTLESLKNGNDRKVFKQANKTKKIITMLGLEKVIKLQIFFVNCITQQAAEYLMVSLKVKSLGCIQAN